MNKYKKLASNTLIFAIGGFGSKLLMFLLTYLYTDQMSTNDYGTKELLETTANLLIPIVTFSIADAVIRFGLDRRYDKRRVLTNACLAELGGLLVLVLLSPLLHFIPYMKGYTILLFVYICTSSFRQLSSQFIRARGLIKLFALDGILATFSLFLFNLLFIAKLGMGIRGFLISVILSDFLSGLFLWTVAGIHRYFSLRYFSPGLLASMFRFSLPLIPTAVMWIVTGFSDRLFVRYMSGPATLVGESAAGVYSAASRIPNLLFMVSTIFFQAWNISSVTENDSADRSRFYTRVFSAYQSILFIAAGFIIALVHPLSDLLISDNMDAAYADVYQYTPLLVISVLLMAFNQFLSSIYTATRHTRNSFWTALAAMVTNLVLNALLIPKWGVFGAIVATVCSYLICYVIRIVDARRYVPFAVNHRLFTVNMLVLLWMGVAVICGVSYYPLYLAAGVLFLCGINYPALLSTIRKVLKR